MKNIHYSVSLSIAFVVSAQGTFGQALQNGLGDATTIVSPGKIFTSSGNPNAIGDFSNGTLQENTGDFATRHIRWGNAGGIGGSFSGTTNVTAESSPARVGRVPETAVRALLPTAVVENSDTTRRLFSESFTQRVSTSVPGISPDISGELHSNISGELNSNLPLLNGSSPASSINFFPGQKKSRAQQTFSNTMGVPSFDSF